MFSTIVSSLTNLLPGTFFISAYLPVLIFSFLNAAFFYAHDTTFRHLARVQFAHPLSSTTTVLVVASIVAAYVVNALADFMRELLEGRHLPPWLKRALSARHTATIAAYDVAFGRARELASDLGDAQRSAWASALDRTTTAGDGSAPAEVTVSGRTIYQGPMPWRLLENVVRDNDPFAAVDVEWAVAALRAARAAACVRCPAERVAELDLDVRRLLVTIDYARDLANENEVRAYTRRHTRYGLTAMPTRFGNVGASIQSYPTTRYGIDLDTFWSRLQGILPEAGEKPASSLVGAKMQLDFLVSCTWLAAVSTAFWLVMLVLYGRSVPPFLAMAIAGPAAVALLSFLAKPSYLAYGMIVRATIDLHRFTLLEGLHLRRPTGIRSERRLWRGLRELSSFSTQEIELSYDPAIEEKGAKETP